MGNSESGVVRLTVDLRFIRKLILISLAISILVRYACLIVVGSKWIEEDCDQCSPS